MKTNYKSIMAIFFVGLILFSGSISLLVASAEGVVLFVSAVDEGVRFSATSTGTYRFTIVGGACQVCPPEAAPGHPEWWGWRTEILIYKNRPIVWSGGAHAPEHPNPANWDFSVGDASLQPTYEEAVEIGRGLSVDIPLEENDYVILVVDDSKGYFWDNSGGVYFSIIILEPLAIAIDIDPNTLNLNSGGKWITCYIELPDGYGVVDINISTILLNDVVPAEDHPTNIGDYDNDGIPDLMVKFGRQEVINILEPGENVAITITGKLFDETMFEGTDYIKVI